MAPIQERLGGAGDDVWWFPGVGITNDSEIAQDWADVYAGRMLKREENINPGDDIEALTAND